jgi:hypothetical protein
MNVLALEVLLYKSCRLTVRAARILVISIAHVRTAVVVCEVVLAVRLHPLLWLLKLPILVLILASCNLCFIPPALLLL